MGLYEDCTSGSSSLCLAGALCLQQTGLKSSCRSAHHAFTRFDPADSQTTCLFSSQTTCWGHALPSWRRGLAGVCPSPKAQVPKWPWVRIQALPIVAWALQVLVWPQTHRTQEARNRDHAMPQSFIRVQIRGSSTA